MASTRPGAGGTPVAAASPRWLLLAHQLPTRPSHGRVKTWRRLQQLGAVPTRNSVYVLPNSPQCREDFEWIRSEIVAAGGEATVFAADALDAAGDRAIVEAFRKGRDGDYAALKREADHLLAALGKPRRAAAQARESLDRTVRSLRGRFADIERIDFCHAPGRQLAAQVLAALERRLTEHVRVPSRTAEGPSSAADFHSRRWVTRPRPGVDRMASAWLIRRFIDPRATFAFVDRPADGDVPFDMYTGEFSHQGPLCTFEVLADRFASGAEVVDRLGHIVHDLDMKETRYAAPEGAAVGRMIEGLRQMHADDHALLEQGIVMFEALARSFETGITGRRPTTRAKRQQQKSRRRIRNHR